jgi:hypothetical protein
MRFPSLAGLVLLMAAAGCDDVALSDVDSMTVDAGADANAKADANADADVALAPLAIASGALAPGAAAPIDSVTHEPVDAAMLGGLTEDSGRLGMIMDLGEGHAVGAIVRVSDGDEVVLRRGHVASEDEQPLLGATVTLYQADGRACSATVTRFVEVARVIPAAGSQHGNRALWTIAEERNGITVIGELSAPGCHQPILVEQGDAARVATAPRRADADSPVATAALARLHALPRFAAADAAYHQDPYRDATVADWSQLPDATGVVTELTVAGAHYVTAELSVAGDCGDFGATVFAIWRVGSDSALTLVVDSDVAPDGYDLAFDADADGVPELAAVPAPADAVLEQEDFDGCGC